MDLVGGEFAGVGWSSFVVIHICGPRSLIPFSPFPTPLGLPSKSQP